MPRFTDEQLLRGLRNQAHNNMVDATEQAQAADADLYREERDALDRALAALKTTRARPKSGTYAQQPRI